MSLFADILGGVLGLGGLGLNQYNQNKQNEFNAKEAEKNRQFQSSEAEIARQWQEDFYNQYQSPQAMVHQYEQAGINPVLAVGQGTNTPPAVSSSQGSQASATAPSYQNVANIVEMVGKMALLKSEIGVNESQAQKNIAEAYENQQRGFMHNSYVKLNNTQSQKFLQEIEHFKARTDNEKETKSLLILEQALKRQQGSLNQHQININAWKKEVYDKYGFYPSDYTVDTVITSLSSVVGSFTNAISHNLGDMFRAFLKKKK